MSTKTYTLKRAQPHQHPVVKICDGDFILATTHDNTQGRIMLGYLIGGIARSGDKLKDEDGKYVAGTIGNMTQEQLSPETSA